MTAKKILLLSVSAGAGHVRAAEALKAYAHLSEGQAVATHLDVMDFVNAGFRKLYTDFYITLVNKAPALWGYLYKTVNEAKTDSSLQKLRRGIERLNTKALLKEITAFKPDAIICTHFLPAEILSALIRKGKLIPPVWVQVTDFDLHRLWVQEHITGYFAANEEVAFRMRAQGIAAQNIYVTGIPIMPAFARPPLRSECTAELGIDPDRATFLLMGGGAGLGSLSALAKHLLALEGNFQLIALAGKNTEELAALQTLAKRYPDRLLPQGFTQQVERLMACADLVITKPGGLTTSECLAMGLAMILNAPIPGQEERNADFLLEQGVALKAIDPITLLYRIQYLMQHPEKLRQMQAQAQALAKPDAARQVLNIVLEKLNQ
ncbi:MAG: galactosyldiacylglycerol synthase [Burkholderiaceae bacterium]|nr:galactosyldiacylglycerol synthase [Burkholderiaceae bacterium]